MPPAFAACDEAYLTRLIEQRDAALSGALVNPGGRRGAGLLQPQFPDSQRHDVAEGSALRALLNRDGDDDRKGVMDATPRSSLAVAGHGKTFPVRRIWCVCHRRLEFHLKLAV